MNNGDSPIGIHINRRPHDWILSENNRFPRGNNSIFVNGENIFGRTGPSIETMENLVNEIRREMFQDFNMENKQKPAQEVTLDNLKTIKINEK